MIISVPIPPEEGIGTYVYNLSSELIKRGNSISIITRGTDNNDCIINDNITLYKRKFLPIYPLHVFYHSIHVKDLIKDIKDDIDIFHFHTPLPAYFKTNKPSVLTVHTPMKTDSRHAEKDLLGYLIRFQAPVSAFIEKKLINYCSKITTVSESVASELSEYGVPYNNVDVINNAVNENIFIKKHSEPKRPYILFVGRLAHRKGLYDLIKCFQIVAKANSSMYLYIVGKGPLENNIKSYIQDLGLSNKVIFIGHIHRSNIDELVEIYCQAKVFVQSSTYEGLPTVLLEAMSCGCPVVATNISGNNEVVKSNYNGILVQPGNPSEMANAVITLIKNESLSSNLGVNARKTIESSYTWEKIAHNFYSLYKRLV